jgi:hypothetical protein
MHELANVKVGKYLFKGDLTPEGETQNLYRNSTNKLLNRVWSLKMGSIFCPEPSVSNY